MFKRIKIAWKLSGIVRDLEFWSGAIPRLEAMRGAIPHTVEKLDAFLPKLDALERVLARVQAMGDRMPDAEVIVTLSSRLSSIESAVSKIESLAYPPVHTSPVKNDIKRDVPKQDLTHKHEWERLRMLAKFCQLEGKAKEIEKEWQTIQQNEHDAFFEFQTFGPGQSEKLYLYKKGITDGIKWCVNRFC